ncbi:manganese transport protein MntH [Klebsiella aerogenes]|nr:manganese transport protein MntH [Klebsiella aerogenes]
MTSSRVENSSSRAARKVKLALMGPAFVAAIGYIDPGNFATNIQAGASFGYQLLWVVVWANLMAMLIQVLSAKLGIATGKNLAEQIRDHYPRPVVWFYWVQAEIIAMATDLAEFIGAAIGFKLVLGVSLLQGAVLTGVATFLILMLQRRGQKPLGEGDRRAAVVCRCGLCRGVDLFSARAGPPDKRAGDPYAAQRRGGILSRRGTGGDHYAARYLLTFLAYPASARRYAERTL